jgi:hypothetical protein
LRTFSPPYKVNLTLRVIPFLTSSIWNQREERPDGTIELHADLAVEDKDFKGTKKLTWIAIDEKTNFEITLVELDHLITKKKVEENEKV